MATTAVPFVDQDLEDDTESDSSYTPGSEDESSSDDSDFDTPVEDDQILESYKHLSSRRVDLVGDYAGNELFLIDGDSLLTYAFSDPNLDFTDGYQMLHASYLVENCLGHLKQRKCNFHIAFFEDHPDLSVPSASSDESRPKYALARAAIMRHLQINLPATHPDIKIYVFPSIHDQAFSTYLDEAGMYFMMCHDGAISQHALQQSTPRDTDRENQKKTLFRSRIMSFIKSGYNVALINGLEYRDTKIMTMVLEGSRRLQTKNLSLQTATPNLDSLSLDDGHPKASLLAQKLEDNNAYEGLSERERLVAVVLSGMLLDRGQIADKYPDHSLLKFAQATLIQTALLHVLPLSSRRLREATPSDSTAALLNIFAGSAKEVLQEAAWVSFQEKHPAVCDVADVIDGRLLSIVCKGVAASDLPLGAQQKLSHLYAAIETICGAESELKNVPTEARETSSSNTPDSEEETTSMSVLPFSNPVFDKHLESIHLSIDDDVAEQSSSSARIFQEVSHWHNAKRPIMPKAQPTMSAKDEFWAARRNQWFMAEMRTYAASLTNAVGKSLEPETLVVGASQPIADASAEREKAERSGKKPPKPETADKKKSGGGKKGGKNTGKQAIMDSIAAVSAKKEEQANEKVVHAWHTIVKNLAAESDLPSRYTKAKDYMTNLPKVRRDVVGGEVELYMLSTLVEYWIQLCRSKENANRLGVAALIWHTARSIPKNAGLTKTINSKVELTVSTLALPPVTIPEATHDRALPFKFALPAASSEGLAIKLSSKEFQLLHCGPYLDRSIDSAPDPRVEFEPDGWQRRVLDGIDANRSLFVVAPTSAGKTFISFYAMRKVLEADDNSVLVYVAPTKALVNQIAAEIQARYSKKFKYGGKSVWAIHTRDYRINNPQGCQVLVTVPHVLQIMLLAPSHANSWSTRVKRIIFDEVHSIGNAEDGVVWEQLLLLAPCPIIALSATVGNPLEFSGWLSSTQKSMGIDLEMVQHTHRYSDLRKFIYTPPKKFVFNGLSEKGGFGNLGLDGTQGFAFLHPVASLVNRSRGIPADFNLEPRDCFTLWQVMSKNANKNFPVSSGLDPAKALGKIIRKIDVIKWENDLKDLLSSWMADRDSPFDAVISDLNGSFYDSTRLQLQTSKSSTEPEEAHMVDEHDLLDTTLPLLCRLNEQGALPAIFFNFERGLCERIVQTVVGQLQEAEQTWKETNPKWASTVKAFEEWKKVQEKKNAKNSKASKNVGKKTKEDREDAEGGKMSKTEQQRDAGAVDSSAFERFDPDAPVEGFHFADHKKLQASELAEYIRQLGRRHIPQWLIDAVTRGIGVHHAGMNRKYRQVVEILFRKGFLRVIIATGTLALGINMPCKTVVFSGDSVFLTALNFRQCAGRAGRRGFDLLGNIVFQNISRPKVCRLLSSRLPDLNGHFPITTTLVLRLFTLLHESKQSKYATKAINTLLSQPRLYMGGPSFKEQTLHHLRFSIEYLRRQHLLDSSGATLNFAGLVSHLYFTENASFAFHALLKEGYFHKLCADIDSKENATVETLMLVLSHLFGRVYCRQADEEYREKVVKPSSSIVFLPPLPEEASRVLSEHSQQTLQVFTTYVRTFVDQHVKGVDNELPLTGMKAGAAEGKADDSSVSCLENETLPATKIRSQFYGLSGHSDAFNSVEDLCRTTRSGVFLEESVVPHVGLYPQDLDVPLNAYLLDFFKHGDIETLERANRVRKSEVWFLLNDFSLVLATIITSLMNFMKLKPANDMDMVEIMGNLDAVEEAEDDVSAATETETGSVVDSVISDPGVRAEKGPVVSKTKAKKLDSWENAADEEERFEKKTANAAAREAEIRKAEMDEAAWEGQGGEQGLLKVLKAFQKLHTEFNVKFKAMWA
ncbi:hypothetical protein MBLNU459_g3401t1 [Dothideomycetes sp. NU459]